MKQFLIDNNWNHYSTGCSCQGKPMYYKNANYPGYIIVIRGNYGIIRFGGVEKFKTNDINQFKTKYEETFKVD